MKYLISLVSFGVETPGIVSKTLWRRVVPHFANAGTIKKLAESADVFFMMLLVLGILALPLLLLKL